MGSSALSYTNHLAQERDSLKQLGHIEAGVVANRLAQHHHVFGGHIAFSAGRKGTTPQPPAEASN